MRRDLDPGTGSTVRRSSAVRRLIDSSVWTPLRVRDYRLLWTGQTTSSIGDGFTTVALAWQAYTLSPTAGSLSAVLLARSIPWAAMLLIGGAITDRFPRRLVMLGSDIGRGLVVGSMAVLGLTGHLALWHLVLMGGLFGVANAFFYPAATAILPELVPPNLLLAGNALRSTSQLISQDLIGPICGGIVVGTITASGAFAVDAISFFVSAACLWALSARLTRREGSTHLLRQVADGLKYAWVTGWIRVSLAASAIATFLVVGPMLVLLPLLIKTVFHAPPVAFGLTYACLGVGGGVAGLLSGQRGAPRRHASVMYGGWILASVAMGCIGLLPSVTSQVAYAAALIGVAGFGFTFGNLLWETLLQTLVPKAMVGRISSLDWLVSYALMPLSYAIVAPVAKVLGSAQTLAYGGFLAAIVVLLALTHVDVRALDKRTALSSPRQSAAH